MDRSHRYRFAIVFQVKLIHSYTCIAPTPIEAQPCAGESYGFFANFRNRGRIDFYYCRWDGC